MPIETEQQAAEALAQAVNQDSADRGDAPTIEQRAEQIRAEQAPQTVGSDPGITTPDSFTGLDPNAIPDEARPFYDSMLADYRRKTQEIAEERRQYETLDEFGGVDAALEAVQFATALATDPQYALEVHSNLTQALVDAGLTPAQASEEASRQVTEAAQGPSDDDYGFESEPDSRIVQELQQVKQELSAFQEWRDQQEEVAFHQALESEMDRQEWSVMQKHPEYTDFDRDNLYNLAYATGGNLEAADDIYQNMRQSLIGQYIEQKGAAPAGVSPLPSGVQSAQEPVNIAKLDLFGREMEQLVNERLAQDLAQQS